MLLWTEILSASLVGRSFADIEREVNLARRAAALNGRGLDHYLSRLIVPEGISKPQRRDIAVRLVKCGLATQRRAHEITGVARETIRARIGDINKQGRSI